MSEDDAKFFRIDLCHYFPFGFLTRNRKLFNASFPERMHIKKNKLKKKTRLHFYECIPLKTEAAVKGLFLLIYLLNFFFGYRLYKYTV